MIWAVGAVTDTPGREKFDIHLRKLLNDEVDETNTI